MVDLKVSGQSGSCKVAVGQKTVLGKEPLPETDRRHARTGWRANASASHHRRRGSRHRFQAGCKPLLGGALVPKHASFNHIFQA